MNHYKDFTDRLKLLVGNRPRLIATVLGNIFTMRLIGNKTHGDLAEIAIAEFIKQYMYDFDSVHVGKDLFRAKSKEEDIKIINKISKAEFPVSLKAYGLGPLQLSTDKEFRMFPELEKESAGKNEITGKSKIKAVFKALAFKEFKKINVLPLIYNEKLKKCNILVFDSKRALKDTAKIRREENERGRKHPVYRFYNASGGYICEVRYGNASSNALQRGLWTHTKMGERYFDSLTSGWIDYSHNYVLVQLFSNALVSSKRGHKAALKKIQDDICRLIEETEI